MEYNMGPYKPNPKGNFDPTARYKYFDLVKFNGGSYLNINEDLTDGISCIGILPDGQPESELYWMNLCERGNNAASYLSFKTLTVDDECWDYDETDKIIIPTNYCKKISIINAYDGCCGMIITDNLDLQLPDNSEYSNDFGYVEAVGTQYYMYTFVCMKVDSDLKFLWNRTVMNRGKR